MSNNPVKLTKHYIEHFSKKADHNKLEALSLFKLVMLASLSAPLFVAFGNEILTSKIIPSILSLAAALGTAWLQLRKPQSLWFTYRNTQRQLEKELHLYEFQAGHYKASENAELTLVENVLKLCEQAHLAWSKEVPNIEQLNKSIATKVKPLKEQ